MTWISLCAFALSTCFGRIGRVESGHVRGLGPLPQVGMPFPLNYDNTDGIISAQN